jgi:hypothetical protein
VGLHSSIRSVKQPVLHNSKTRLNVRSHGFLIRLEGHEFLANLGQEHLYIDWHHGLSRSFGLMLTAQGAQIFLVYEQTTAYQLEQSQTKLSAEGEYMIDLLQLLDGC